MLITTAKRLFLADGYQATTIDKVAAAAGFTKGAVYSNFRTKDGLCLAVLDEIRGERVAEIADILSAPTTAGRLQRIAAWAEHVIDDPNWTQLELEFSVQARHNDQLRVELATRLNAIVDMISTALRATDDVDTQVPPAEAAVAMLALGVGLGMFRTMDPRISVAGMISALGAIAGLPQTADAAGGYPLSEP
ncbi:TetR/AcrR family transcriptional regulator [Nocardia sp. NPDC049220]|uniref:TetR/AcrR family transcriptional regulator n=1 Tax=Nocardia sp. NPDC049220 TaxID=3155273 RepID=UPI00340D482F